MRLESNTIGNVDNPTAEDVHRAFHDDFEDVAGNIYALCLDDGTTLCSVSGDHFKAFSLTLGNGTDLFRACTKAFSRDEAEQYFLRSFRGDNTWVSELEWKEERA